MPLETLNYWAALGAVGMQIGAVILLAVFLLRKKIPDLEDIAALVGRWGVWLALALALAALGMSLYYSEVLGIVACSLCWWQRIFMYPLVPLFALALMRREEKMIALYAIVLSVIGAGFALYQHALQTLGEGSLPCPANPEGISCAQRFLFEFGYVTFPLIAFSLFAFVIVIMLFVRKYRS